MISLDTNVVLRFLLNDAPDQAELAKEIIQSKKVYVTDVVVVEVIYVLERVIKLERAEIAELVLGFLGFTNVTYNYYFLQDAVNLYLELPALSIVDCYAATEAQVYKNKLASFDKQLVRQGGSHVFTL